MRRFVILAVMGCLVAALLSLPEARTTAGQAVGSVTAFLQSQFQPKTALTGKDGKRGGNDRDRAVSVETAEARATAASDDLRAIGGLESDESTQITTEIAGRIAEFSFEDGKPVKKGAILAKLDEALARAEVADAQARFNLAESNLGRAKALSRTGNVTEKAQDEAVSNFGVAQAALELAKVRLAKHEIRAPFDGTVGIRRVSPGAYAGAGTAIVNLEKIDPINVDFKIPEVYFSRVAPGQTIEISVDALPGRVFEGTIEAIDPHLDVNGRALSIRARLPNSEGLLLPGLFARIVIKGADEREAVTVPESAVVPRAGQTLVYRVEDGKAIETKVTLGQRADGAVEIVQGLTPGAIVVVAGQQKLRNGSAVDITAAAAAPPPSKRRS